MRTGRKFNSGIIIGAAAGTALGWLIFSKQGKKVRKDTQAKISQTTTDLQQKFNEASHNLKAKVSSEIDHLTEKVQSAWNSGKEQVEEVARQAESNARKSTRSTS